MSQTVISVENLSKQYRLGQIGGRTLTEDLNRWWARTRRKPNPYLKIGQEDASGREGEYIWALRDVSFEVQQGEVLGIIGRNGAGKSTLLKILSRITAPTSGVVKVKGRIASLLEVGTGFHPELTGRENIYLNGAILGMKTHEIDRKFDEIVDFSGVEKFIDTPVKRYSSGMYVRLAFAVAAHLDPEILVVDEVLAVGDAEFQRKCLGKMGEVAKEGRTVLFVSHNMGSIARLCGRSFWLDVGKVVLDGPSPEVVRHYQSHYVATNAQWYRRGSAKQATNFAFLTIDVRNTKGKPSVLFEGDEPILIEIRYVVYHPLSSCQIGTRLYNSDGIVVFTTTDADNSDVTSSPKETGQYQTCFTIPGNYLAPGTYSLLVAGHFPRREIYEVIEQAVTFEVAPSKSLASLDGRLGVVAPLLRWNTIRENPI